MEYLINQIKLLVWLIKFIGRLSPFEYILLFVCQIILKLEWYINSFIIGVFINALTAKLLSLNSDSSSILWPIIVFIVTQVLFSAFQLLQRSLEFRTEQRGSNLAQFFMFDKLNELAIEQIESPETMNLYSRVRSHIGNIGGFVHLAFIRLPSSVIVAILGCSLLFSISPVLVILLVLISIPRTFVTSKINAKYYAFMQKNGEEDRKSWDFMQQLSDIEDLKEIRILGAFEYIKLKAIEFKHKYLKYYFRVDIFETAVDFFFALLKATIVACGLWLIYQSVNDISKVGIFSVYLTALISTSDDFDTMVSLIANANQSSVKYQDTKTFFEIVPLNDNGIEKVEDVLGVKLEVRNVSFKYPSSDKFVLKNISFVLNPGEKLAVVGENGAGKTTLTKLICKFYSGYEGEIFVNNENIKDISSESLLRHMSLLSQDFVRYEALNLRENVEIGNLKNTSSDYKEALNMSNSLAFVEEYKNKFEQGLSSTFTEGVLPSKGQWQKIAIARFFYRNSPLVILDEPTSSIDPASEGIIFQNIFNSMVGKTVIIISHRFNTIKKADKIIVMNEGEIAEMGNHETLMKLNGLYAKAYNIQLVSLRD